MTTSAALSSLTATYRYLRYLLSNHRPAEIDMVQAYLDRVKMLFEDFARTHGYVAEWAVPSVYVQDIFKTLPTISTYAKHSYGHGAQSDTSQEFTLWNGVTGTEITGVLFVENAFTGYSVTCRLISITGEFTLKGHGNLDFVTTESQWPAHEALLNKAILDLLDKILPAKAKPRRKLKVA